jgi:hypothetical protein
VCKMRPWSGQKEENEGTFKAGKDAMKDRLDDNILSRLQDGLDDEVNRAFLYDALTWAEKDARLAPGISAGCGPRPMARILRTTWV